MTISVKEEGVTIVEEYIQNSTLYLAHFLKSSKHMNILTLNLYV